MNLLSFFNGIVIEKKYSKYNGEIQVIEFLGQNKIIAGGLIQSGGVLKDIWKKAIKKACLSSPKKILILGLGGGTIAQLVSRKWPRAKITGIEIDPLMINLAKKHFDLDKITNLKIIQADAIDFVISGQQPAASKFKKAGNRRLATGSQKSFDLILVDLYKGEEMPKQTAEKKFLQSLKKITRQNGLIIFNHLFYKQHKQKAKDFVKKLEKIFPKISFVRALSNLMVYCSPST